MTPASDRVLHTLYGLGAFMLWYAISVFVAMFPDYRALANRGLLMPVLCILEFAALLPFYRWYCQRHDNIPFGVTPLRLSLLFVGMLLALLVAENLFIHDESWVASQTVNMNSSARVAFILAVVFLAPVFEEILFRGFILQGILQWFPGQRFACALLTSLVFAAMHTQYANLETIIALVGLSLLLCYARYASAGLKLPVALHMLNNGLAVLPLIGAFSSSS